MNELRFRQVHLDFHTSEQIHGVGADFSARQFQEALKRGHVDSVTLFSKCHHGLSYHRTEVGKMHPGLDFELLPRQIEACRAIDVKCPIYISAGLDEWSAWHRPEWIIVSREGKMFDPKRAGWKVLGFDTPYLDYLCEQIVEVVEKLDAADGIFLDIIALRENFSPLGLTKMRENGVDILDDDAVRAWKYAVLQHYYEKTTAACKVGDESRRVFHNSGHIPKGAPDTLKWNSHLELESLPTGGWGYDHFPISAKYAATTGFDFLGMTGKFHTTWGEFGGFKRPEALRYECAAMLAFGAKCSVGDQLHPRGAMSGDTYALIGAAYEEVAAKEDWCRAAQPVSEIALVSPEALHASRPRGHANTSHAEEGAARMLLETQQQFDVVDLERDLSPYRLVILPDEMILEGAFLGKIEAFRQGGGKLLLSGDSGLNAARDGFAFDLGLELVGRSEWDPDYIIPTEKTPTPIVRGPFVMHGGAWDVRIGAGSDMEVLARRARPYFNREWNHFCSHQHTPDESEIEFPAALGNGEAVYFAHSIFTRYRLYGQPLYRDLVRDAMASLLGEPCLSTNLPSTGRASLMRQEAENRYILHLLYATPVLRGGSDAGGQVHAAWSLEVIEDLVPLHDILCRVRVSETIRSVTLEPGGETLDWTQSNGVLSFCVPKVFCHQMVVLNY